MVIWHYYHLDLVKESLLVKIIKSQNFGTLLNEHFLPILYELDSPAEWTDPTAWTKTTPALNTIKKFDDLNAQVERASTTAMNCRGYSVKNSTSEKP